MAGAAAPTDGRPQGPPTSDPGFSDGARPMLYRGALTGVGPLPCDGVGVGVGVVICITTFASQDAFGFDKDATPAVDQRVDRIDQFGLTRAAIDVAKAGLVLHGPIAIE